MSLNRVQPSFTPLASTGPARRTGVALPDTAPNNPGDTVRLSDRGVRMSRLAAEEPPTPEALRKRSAALADDLGRLLRQSPGSGRHSVEFEVDPYTGDIGVSGDAAAPQTIATLIGGRPDIGRQIREVASLGRLLDATEPAAEAHQSARATQIGVIMADYAARLDDQSDPQDFSSIASQAPRGPAVAAVRGLETYAAAAATAPTGLLAQLLSEMGGAFATDSGADAGIPGRAPADRGCKVEYEGRNLKFSSDYEFRSWFRREILPTAERMAG